MPTQGFAGFTFTTVDLDEAAHVAVQNAVRDEIAARDPGNARIAWDQLAQLPNLRGMAMPADARRRGPREHERARRASGPAHGAGR